MPSKSKNSIADQLNIGEIRIGNSLKNEDIKAEVAKKGYTEVKLQEGYALVTSARTAVNKQISAKGAAENATKTEGSTKVIAHKAYQDFSQTARAIFNPNSPQLTILGLTGVEPKDTARFIKAGYTMFDNAKDTPDILNCVQERGYTVEILISERAKIQAYENANSAQVTLMGDAEEATKQQNIALKAMNDWVSEYTKIAKVALGKNNKLLEKIGIFTGKRTKKKNDKKDNPPLPQ